MAYGETQAQTAQNTGQGAINSFDPNAVASNTRGGFNNLYGQQNATQNEFINQYKQTIANNPSVTGLYNTANTMFNVPALAANANQLQNAVLQAPQQTLDTAKGFNYDANQVANQTNLTLGRLSPLAAAAQNQLGTAQGLAQGYVQAGLQQNQFNLLPIQAQQQYLSELYARQQAGYTQAAQQEYEGLLAKMQQGVQLSATEMQRANQLAQSEASYNAAKLSTQNVVLNPAQGYLNTLTGKMTPFRGR